MSLIYQPAEDSYLLESVIKLYVKDKSVLDMGSGSGILAESALRNGAKSVTAVDINQDSIKILKNKKINAIKSNLFEKVHKSKKFDIILFNPPYLPEDKREDKVSSLATTGGKRGDEIIIKFLEQAPKHLNNGGIILLLLSSLTPQDKILKLIGKQSLKHKLIASKKIFFEELFVWEIS